MKLLAPLLIALLALIFTACGSTDDPDSPEPVIYNIVTYESTAEDGTTSTFTYRVNEDSPLISLVASWKAPESVKPGTRLLIGYTTSAPGVSGVVVIKMVSQIPGGEPKISAEVPVSEPMQMRSIWRTGTYLNLNSVVTISGEASEIALYVDEKTVSSSVPQAYVVIGMGNGPVDGEQPKLLYASWDIARVWNPTYVNALEVHYTDAYHKQQIIRLNKNQ